MAGCLLLALIFAVSSCVAQQTIDSRLDTLTEIMLTEKNDEYSMYAKTGWATTTQALGII